MRDDQRDRVIAALSPALHTRSSNRVCRACSAVLDMTGAGITLIADGVPTGSLCTSDPISEIIEDLQFTLGEGPCLDAYRDDRVVSEPDLARNVSTRWPAFAGPALDAGARALFAFPLRTGTARLGAINFYRDVPGVLEEDQHSDGLVVGDLVARWVLEVQGAAPEGVLATQIEEGANPRFVVYNAAGMTSAQLGISVDEAMVRLRAYAFSNARTLNTVAEDVVNRRLRIQ